MTTFNEILEVYQVNFEGSELFKINENLKKVTSVLEKNHSKYRSSIDDLCMLFHKTEEISLKVAIANEIGTILTYQSNLEYTLDRYNVCDSDYILCIFLSFPEINDESLEVLYHINFDTLKKEFTVEVI